MSLLTTLQTFKVIVPDRKPFRAVVDGQPENPRAPLFVSVGGSAVRSAVVFAQRLGLKVRLLTATSEVAMRTPASLQV